MPICCSRQLGKHIRGIPKRAPTQSIWTERNQTLHFKAGIHYPLPPAYRTFRFRKQSDLLGEQNDLLKLSEIEFFGTPFEISMSAPTRDSEGNILLQWSSIPDETYAVDLSSDLQNWTEVNDTVPATGRLTKHIIEADAVPVGNAFFFRVRNP